MDVLDAISAIWSIFVGFIGLVIVLAKQHADVETLKEKVRVLFELWNGRER